MITPQLYSPLYLLIVEREGRVEPLLSLSLSLSLLSLPPETPPRPRLRRPVRTIQHYQVQANRRKGLSMRGKPSFGLSRRGKAVK